MATKPTKLQQIGRDKLAEALNLIAEAARLDGRSPTSGTTWATLASQVSRTSSEFPLDQIVARALERRAIALGLSASTAEVLTLVETTIRPLDLLLVDDEQFREAATAIDEELGGL